MASTELIGLLSERRILELWVFNPENMSDATWNSEYQRYNNLSHKIECHRNREKGTKKYDGITVHSTGNIRVYGL